MCINPGQSEAGVSMQKVKPIITNIDWDLYRFLRTMIYEERGGPAWYCFSFLWLVSMLTITMVVISGMAAIGPDYISSIDSNDITLILFNFFNELAKAFLLYVLMNNHI